MWFFFIYISQISPQEIRNFYNVLVLTITKINKFITFLRRYSFEDRDRTLPIPKGSPFHSWGDGNMEFMLMQQMSPENKK